MAQNEELINIELKIKAAESAKNVIELKKSIKDLKNAAANVDENSEAFKRLVSAAGEAKDKIDDLNRAVNSQAGKPIENLASSYGLLGDKLQNLDFKGAASAAAGLTQNLGKMNFNSLSEGVGEFGTSLLNIGKAILINPLFLLAATIVGVGVALYELKDKIKVIGDIFNGLSESIKGVRDLFFALTDSMKITAEALENSVNSQIKNLNRLYEHEKRINDDRLNIVQAYGEGVKKQQAENITAEILHSSAIMQQYEKLLRAKQELTEEQRKDYENQKVIFQNAQIESQKLFIESQKVIKDAIKKSTEEAESNSAKTESAKVAIEKKRAIEAAERIKQDAIDTGTSVEFATELHNKRMLALNAEFQKKEADARKKDYDDYKAKADAKGKVNEERAKKEADRLKQQEAADKSAEEYLAGLDKKEESEEEKKSAEEARLLSLSLDRYQQDVKAKEEAAEEKKKINNAEFTIAQGASNAINALGVLAGQNTEAGIALQKTAALSQIAIDTAKAISTTIASATEAAAETGPAAPFVAAGYIAMGIGTVLSNIAKAKQLLDSVPGPSAGGSGNFSASGGGGGTNSFSNGVNGGFTGHNLQPVNQLDTNGTHKPIPQKVFIVSTDISKSQNADKMLERRASYSK